MKFSKNILALIVSLLSTTLMSQNISDMYMEKLKPITPAQYQLQRYGEIEMNEYQGKPLIDFELWEIKTKGFSLPIKLSYTSNGIKVFDESDWVGMGWDLSIASINQFVNGIDDLKTEGIRMKIPYLCGQVFGLYTYSQSSIPNFTSMSIDNSNQDWDSDCSYSFLKVEDKGGCNQWPATNYFPFGHMHQLYIVDSEKDVFVINLLGEQLFCVIKNFESYDLPAIVNFEVLNKKGYKVNYRSSGVPFKWEVIDPSGNIFIFNEENKYSNITISYTMFGPSFSIHESAHSWQLTKITDIFGDEINLNYTKNTGIQSSSILEARKVGIFNKSNQGVYWWDSNSWVFSENSGPFNSMPNYVKEGVVSVNYDTQTSTTAEKSYLESITYRGNTVKFHTQNNRIDWLNTSKLDSISVINSANSKIKSIVFNYDYHTTNTDTIIRSNKTKDEATKRLFLVSMKQQDQVYRFVYNETQLPSKDSYAVDFWGHYNGQTNNPSKIPNILHFSNESYNLSLQTQIVNNTANLYPNEDYAKAGILNKIEYPTGGYTVYSHSLNSFNNYPIPQLNNQPQGTYYGNGLKVDTISNYDHNGKLLNQKMLFYEDGKLLNPFKHFITSLEQYAEISSGGGLTKPVYLYSGQILTIYSSSQYSSGITGGGSGVGYGKVTSSFLNMNNSPINGKTVRYYQNEPDVLCPVSMGELIPIVPTYHKGLINGTVLREESYMNNSLINTVSHMYSIVYNSDTIFHNAKVRSLGYVNDGTACMEKRTLQISYYPIYKTGILKTQMKSTAFINNDSITSTIDYIYNSDNFIKKVFKQESHQNKLNIEEFLYPKDIILSNNFTTEQKNIMTNLISNNRISENIVNIKTISISNNQSTSTQHTYYDQSLCLPIKTLKSVNSSPFYTTLLIKYNANKDICEITNDENLFISYIWSYDGQYPVAEIKNATYDEVLNTNPGFISFIESSSYPNSLMLESLSNSLRSNLPNALITTYTYKPLVGVITSTDPRGVKTYYEYDTLNRLKCIRKNNQNGAIIQSYEYKYKQQ